MLHAGTSSNQRKNPVVATYLSKSERAMFPPTPTLNTTALSKRAPLTEGSDTSSSYTNAQGRGTWGLGTVELHTVLLMLLEAHNNTLHLCRQAATVDSIAVHALPSQIDVEW
eukprot:6484947-Amphidinium_carterae.1